MDLWPILSPYWPQTILPSGFATKPTSKLESDASSAANGDKFAMNDGLDISVATKP